MNPVGGTPTVWSSRVVSGRYFLRSDATDLLPVKETPLARSTNASVVGSHFVSAEILPDRMI